MRSKAACSGISERLVSADKTCDAVAAHAIRSLIDRIVLEPGEARSEVRATLHGELMGILDLVRDER